MNNGIDYSDLLDNQSKSELTNHKNNIKNSKKRSTAGREQYNTNETPIYDTRGQLQGYNDTLSDGTRKPVENRVTGREQY